MVLSATDLGKKFKRIFASFSCIIFILSFQTLNAQKSQNEPWKYNINVELNDSTLWVNLHISTTRTQTGQNNFLLFNRYIQIDEALLNNKPFKYTRSNDTMYFESFPKEAMTLFMRYKIHCSTTGYSKVVSAYSDSIYNYPVVFDTSQIFCERFNKWYPVVYDRFCDYKVNVTVPAGHRVFAYYPEINIGLLEGKNVYSFTCYDEDFPFMITPDRFQSHKKIELGNSNLDFYFLPRSKRLVSVTDKKPKYVSDIKQIDSLLNVTINRSIAAIEWYNTNLWKKEITKLSFVETGIFGLGAGLGSFILIDRSLMNREAIDNYALSHEIVHLWLGIHTEYLARGKFFIGESIPEYVNLLFYESWAGKDLFNKVISDKKNLPYSTKPFYTVNFEQVLNQRKGDSFADDFIYEKGPAFVHEFQKMIGKDKLLKIIRETYSVPNHFVTLKDFENSVKANGCWNEYLKLYEITL